jgi:hypothetical protein
MKCKRCKATYYCSKDCQVAGWKLHKELCNQFSSGKLSRSEGISDYHGWAFIKSNYCSIAKEVYKKTQEYGVPKKELLVEIDFYGMLLRYRTKSVFCLTFTFEESTLKRAWTVPRRCPQYSHDA